MRDDGNLVLNNTLISGNLTGTAAGPDLAKLSGSFTGLGVNFIGDTSGSSVPLTGAILSGNALLAPLGDYGGATETMVPMPGSPVIDPVGGESTSPFPLDQRDAARVINGTVDIGAVEYSPIHSMVVDTQLDEDDGIAAGGVSLREAIANTATGGTITFAAGVNGGTITLVNGQLVIDKNLTIDASLLPDGITIDANGSVTHHRVLQVDFGATVVIERLTLTGGKSADGFVGGGGSNGGDGSNGGGILNSGALSLNGCTISGNTSGMGGRGSDGGTTGNGGGGGFGGGIFNNGNASLVLTHCTIANNMTGGGGRGGDGTFSGGGNGGNGGSGGGIHNNISASLTLTHCTLSDNATGNRGLGGNGDFGFSDGSNGSRGSGGGIRDDGNLVLNNTLISGNLTGTAAGPDLSKLLGTFSGLGVNFIGDTSGSSVPLTGSILSGNALLAPLGGYGGATETMVPMPGSPVIDPVGGDSTSPFPLDQRDAARVINGTVDIGAVEYGRSLVVDTMDDENDGASSGGISLRDAIAGTDPGGTITFAPGINGATIELAHGQLEIGRDLTIDASSLPDGITIDANGSVTNHRVLQVDFGTTVVIERLTLTGGKSADGFDGGGGSNGGDGSNGGGILNSGALSLNGCTISGNTSGMGGRGSDGGTTGNGGGGGFGGGIFNNGNASLVLTHCTIASNMTGGGGRGGDGTFSDGGNGGNGGSGGGIHNSISASLTLTHCTLSGNATGNRGLGGNGDFGFSDGSNGSRGSGGGIRDDGNLVLNNTLISGNLTGTAAGPDLAKLSGSFTGLGVNFIGDTSGSTVPLTGSILSGDALLSPLGDYGGPTQTMLPLASSPVIDPAAGSTSSPYSTDQRGFDRVVNGIVDIGAVEYLAPPVTVDTNIDENDGISVGGISLREAIVAAGPGATITFSPALDGNTIILNHGQLVIAEDLTIDASALTGGITIDADGASILPHRVIQINSGARVGLSTLTLTGGQTSDGFNAPDGIGSAGGSGSDGGGIHNSGDLTLTGCTLTGNTTGNGGSGGLGASGASADGGSGGSGGKGGGIYTNTGASLTPMPLGKADNLVHVTALI